MAITKTANTWLHKRDLYNIFEIGQKALSSDSLAELHRTTLKSVISLIGASSIVYAELSTIGQQSRVVNGSVLGVDKNSMNFWRTTYQFLDPVLGSYLKNVSTASSHVVLSSEAITRRDLLTTCYYNEFLRPLNIDQVMAIGLTSPDGTPIGLYGLNRSRREKAFSDEDVAKANLLAPLLRSAVERLTTDRKRPMDDQQGSAQQDENGALAVKPGRLRLFKLSNREVEIVQLVHKGLTNLQMADQLGLSVRTIGNHLNSVYNKASVRNRTGLLYSLTN